MAKYSLALLLSVSSFLSASPIEKHSHSQAHLTPQIAGYTHHSPRQESGLTVSVQQVPNPGFDPTIYSGLVALRQAYLKYNISSQLTASQIKRGLVGSAPASPFPSSFDREYLVPVTIGSMNPQTLNLDLDTGSSDLWVFSTSTPNSEVNGQILYSPTICNLSSCAQQLIGETWNIRYGSGSDSSSSGNVYADKVTIGKLSVLTQAVEAATNVSKSFTSSSEFSGLLGMGFSTINTCSPQRQLTWFDNIKSSLASPLFTANLQKGAVGSYNFGYIETKDYTGPIGYAPVDSSHGYWGFESSGYQIGNSSFVNTPINAIADTGTTLLLLPDDIVSAYYAGIPGSYYNQDAGGYVFPSTSSTPDFTFGIGEGYRGVVPGSYIKFSQYGSLYFGGIQNQGDFPFSIFGDIVLKAQFVVFDMGNLKLGFARKNIE